MCRLAEFIVKYVLFVANFLISLFGLALFGIGVAWLVQLLEIRDVLPGGINFFPSIILILGIIVFAIASFGCCGAIRESRCLLIMYSVCMLILAASKIFLATVVFNWLANISATVRDWVNDAFIFNTNRLSVLEIAFRCCGTTGPASYTGDLPVSCCAETATSTATCALEDAFTTGCVDALASYFEAIGAAIGGVLITVIIIDLVAMFFSMFMCWSISKRR